MKQTIKKIAKRKYTIEHYIKSSAYHRNGIGGDPFIQVHFSYEVLDQGEKGSNMLATIGFTHVEDNTLLDPQTCRVTDLDDLEAQHRGEWFASFLIKDLAKFETRMGVDVEVADFKSHIRQVKGDKCSITGASHAHPSVVRLSKKEQKALEPTMPDTCTHLRGKTYSKSLCPICSPEREYTVTFSRRVAWETCKKDTCQVFAEDIAGAVIAGVETLKMDALIAVDHSDVRIIGVCEVID